MMHECSNGGSEVRFAEEHHARQALGLGGLNKPFGKGVPPRGVGRDQDLLGAETS
jgi:hypothetical protein